tara:strand:- start:985 stop:2553 length:1569 start_codon:yes stop_codon:yes gene_type:complete
MNYNPKKYVLIQARTDSSRLFGKCIFYIRNKELILLLHDRIKSKNYKTVILTSNKKSDDHLSNILKKNKINYYRGNLNNVRNRFIDFTSNLHKEDILVRCTADNLFVDKYIINDLINKFIRSNKKYLKIDRKKSLLPYGMSVEVFTVGALRETKPKNKLDFEHVTPPLIRDTKNVENTTLNLNTNLFNKSCTIDTLYDYFKIKYIFENFNNNVKTKWSKLCKDLSKINKKKIEKKIIQKLDKIIIGTAQFGFQYGINNQMKKISENEISNILNFAKTNYINFIDTAEGYKKSEKRIGKYLNNNKNKFKVMTKIKFENSERFKTSLKKLGLNKLFALFIHNPSQIRNNFDFLKLKNEFIKFKTKLNYFGASLNLPNEYWFLKKFDFFKIFQIPYNILDYRWNEILKKKKKSVKIYARSIFLQGLLITEKKNCPYKLRKEFDTIKKKISFLKNKLNRFDEKDLLFNYVNHNKSINKIIIGIENETQIQQLPFYLLRKKFTSKEIRLIKKTIPKVSTKFITPTNW